MKRFNNMTKLGLLAILLAVLPGFATKAKLAKPAEPASLVNFRLVLPKSGAGWAMHPKALTSQPTVQQAIDRVAKAWLSQVDFYEDSKYAAAWRYHKANCKIWLTEAVWSGVPPSVKASQADIESRQGRSDMAKTANNHYGVKWYGKPRYIGNVLPENSAVRFKESQGIGIVGYKVFKDDGKWSSFRWYDSAWWSHRDHTTKLVTSKLYNKSLGKPLEVWADCLVGVYATDPNYADLLRSVSASRQLRLLDELLLNDPVLSKFFRAAVAYHKDQPYCK